MVDKDDHDNDRLDSKNYFFDHRSIFAGEIVCSVLAFC